MTDNTQLSAAIGTGAVAATAQLTISGDTAVVQMIGCGILSGSEGSWVYSQFVGGAGAVAAGVQRVTLASDDPAVVSLQLLDNAVSGAGFNVTQFAGAAVPIGAGVEATALRVTLATDSTGLLSVDDNSSSLTVDTTGTAGLEVVQVTAADLNMTEASAAAIKTAVEIMDDWDESNRAMVNPIVGQAGIAAGTGVDGATVPRVTLATNIPLPAGTNNIGDVDLVKVGSVVDANNSSTTPLTGDAVYTGTGTDLLGYTAVTCTLYANVDSATDGMTFQFSTDNSNWDDTYTFTMDISSSDTRRFQFPICARYFRIVYTNGSGAQSAFRVQTICHTGNQLTSIHRLVNDMSPDRSAQVVKSVLFAQKAGSGDFTGINSTAGGNLKVAVEEFDTSLPTGDNNIGNVDIVTVPAPLSTTGAGTEATALRVTIANNSTGLVSVDDNGASLTVDQPAVATGGASFFKSIDLDESEEEVKATAATFYGGIVMNLKATVLYLKLYNATAANVTVGTTVPDLTIPIPTQGDTNGAGFIIPVPACGIQFGTALTVACTTGIADNDSGAPGANECAVSLFYE